MDRSRREQWSPTGGHDPAGRPLLLVQGLLLRRDLKRAEAELDALLNGLEELTRSGPYQDIEELVRLQAALADQAKRVELLVRVRLGGEAGAAPFLDGTGAVPPEYRDLVEAYYRSLSRNDGGR